MRQFSFAKSTPHHLYLALESPIMSWWNYRIPTAWWLAQRIRWNLIAAIRVAISRMQVVSPNTCGSANVSCSTNYQLQLGRAPSILPFVIPCSRLNFIQTLRFKHWNPSTSLPHMPSLFGSWADKSCSNIFFHLQKLYHDFNAMTLGFLQALIATFGIPSPSLISKRRLAARWKSAHVSPAKLLKVSFVRGLHTKSFFSMGVKNLLFDSKTRYW